MALLGHRKIPIYQKFALLENFHLPKKCPFGKFPLENSHQPKNSDPITTLFDLTSNWLIVSEIDYTVKNRVLPQQPPFCTMSVGCYSNTPRVLMAPFRVLKHIKHPGDVTVTPQGVTAKFRVQDAAVKNSNIATQLLSLPLVHFKS